MLGIIVILKKDYLRERMIGCFFLAVSLLTCRSLLGVDIPVILSSSALDAEFIAQFALFVGTLLLGTLAIGKILYRLLKLPLIAGQIVGGIVLGPSILNVQSWLIFSHKLILTDLSNTAYSFISSDLFAFIILVISSSITVGYLLWLAGHETDIVDLLRVGVTVTVAGILGALIPIGMTTLALYHFWNYSFVAALGLGLVFSATSVSIPVALFFAKKKLHLRSSKATLGAAIIDDIFAMLLLSFFIIAIQSGVFGSGVSLVGHSTPISIAVFRLITCFIGMFVFGFFVSKPIINYLNKSKRFFLIAPLAFACMLCYFAFAELYGGLAGITGAYFAGLFHRMTDLKSRAIKTLSPFVNSILLPLFLCSIGLQVDFTMLHLSEWIVVIGLLVISIISKLAGTYIATGFSNMVGKRRGAGRWTLLESFIFGSSMVARGEVGLVISTVLKGAQIITPIQYVISVVVIVATTIAAPIMLSIGFSYEEDAADKSYSLLLGEFPNIGSIVIFNAIVSLLEKDKHLGTAINFSEDRKIVTLEEQGVTIIYDPARGLMFKGNRQVIDHVLELTKEALHSDVDKLAQGE